METVVVLWSPEVVEYPDSGKVLALSQLGPLWSMHRRDDAVDYFDGEQLRLRVEKTCTGRTFDVAVASTYPATAMLLANVMDRTRGVASVRLAGPRGAL